MTSTLVPRRGLLERLGLTAPIAIGLAAVTVFLIGDGIESVWLANYLHTTEGFTVAEASAVITAYGIVVAIASFFSGALPEAWGVRRVMTIGLVAFLFFAALFILVALPSQNLGLVIGIYALRGIGYPFFAYGFLTWVLNASAPEKQSPVAGWFWFAFSSGMQIIGPALASVLLPGVGAISTLWVGFALAAIGGIAGIAFLGRTAAKTESTRGNATAALARGLSILWRRPKVSLLLIVKVVNLAGPLAVAVFYVPYLVSEIHLPEALAINVFTVYGISAVIGNVVWGNLGNRIGWHRSTQWIATPLCALGIFAYYYIPQLVGPNFALIALASVIMGAGASAYVPMNPLAIAHGHGETGAIMSVLNLGAGLAAVVGPGLVAALVAVTGYQGIAWGLIALYGLAFVVTIFLKLPNEAELRSAQAAQPAAVPVGH
ncbi:putative MFS family arabinose efflux permease [Mycetocola sp. BIGb0189]|uniref:MFS transporter n=1 Tax=Mycetocola sp. BIGb0189 TaxID=2940604 RepID=UPI002167D617|nr:MFS transporter [Mycetocola sp. BIGb0189]MCS4276310.1 putative MFS family arabinose efflux permease [Mycetocola sp. BIGb0189]